MNGEAAAGFFDFVVTEVPYVIERQPDPAWRPPGGTFANQQAHILACGLSGRAHYEIAGTPYTITPGDVIFMPKGTVHTAASDAQDPWHFVSLWFDAISLSVDDATEQLSRLPHVFSGGLPPDTVGVFSEIFAAWVSQHPGYLVQIRSLLTGLLHRLICAHSLPRLRQPYVARMRKITRMIMENYLRTYSVEELARLADLSPSHFRAVFKNVVGVTATQYQQQVKISKAAEFLVSGECNVTEAAQRAGFNDVYYFSRQFKKRMGANPSDLLRR